MGLIQGSRPQSDDFVFTILDDDDEIPNLDDAFAAESEPSPKATKKRKREAENGESNLGKRRQKTNDNKHEDRGTADIESESKSGDSGLARSQIETEDDGAIDSDFEFQTGERNLGSLEEFDGWELGGARHGQKQGAEKKHVDIDEIISRRQQNLEANDRGSISVDGNQQDEDNSEIGSDAESPFAAFDAEEDEELSAPDSLGVVNTLDDNDPKDLQIDGNSTDDANGLESGDDDVNGHVSQSENASMAVENDNSEDDESDASEADRRAAFFDPDSNLHSHDPLVGGARKSFHDMSLSRPILRALATVGFSTATPIQSKTIPIALLGKDIVGGAITGSGKTAAFIIPILERLLYRPKKIPATRVVVLVPTRELAVQCFNVATKLASFTDITFVQLVGGYSQREQEQQLKKRPDVIIATPGRFIDHMINTASFTVESIEILVLDEADRMLEDGFADELDNVLKTLPRNRQTMLFSATMTGSVDKLIRVGLNRPARLMVDAKRQTVSGLVQEFVRLRPGKENRRLAYLMYLCTEVYTDRVIIFFRQKTEAHRMRVVFGLCGLRAAELHGSMSQEQRIKAIESFRLGSTPFLLATDLASRGLDIRNITTVINYSAPQSHDIYLHRVGRTARAGRSGRACTLAAEPDRKVVKQAVKAARAQGARIASRTVPAEKGEEWAERLMKLEDEIEEVLREEKEERVMAQAEMQATKGDNLIKYENEIMSRPKRVWFETEKEKRAAKAKGRAELNGEETVKKKEKRKLSGKEKKALDDHDERVQGRMWKKGRAGRAGNGGLEKVGKGKKQEGKKSKN
ncbi:MAG: nucleolar DEAD-box protein required for synthesis of 60S ribosomal subunit [Bathelium mastoideum]|nr:MAG: nucleolar DEAD-box protein required for synthesis of 60S ribosomal subunit [Bathelium mastoideum]